MLSRDVVWVKRASTLRIGTGAKRKNRFNGFGLGLLIIWHEVTKQKQSEELELEAAICNKRSNLLYNREETLPEILQCM